MNEKAPPEELFLAMACKDTDPEEARQAYLIFYGRYAATLRKTIETICAYYNVHTAEIEEVLFDNTINRAYRKADKFIDIDKEASLAAKEKRLKSWLYRIAENELRKIMRGGKHDSVNFDSLDYEMSELFIFDDSPPASRLSPDELKWFREGYNTLTDDQKFVIQFIYLRTSGQKHLESEILDELAVKMQITRDSVRQIHFRAKQKIKQYIQSKIQSNEQSRRQSIYERRNL